MSLINREQEQEDLKHWRKKEEPALGCLFGRRRVGKSYLLEQVWKSGRVFDFLAGKATPDKNRRELIDALDDYSPTRLHAEDYEEWDEVFDLIFKLSEQQPLTVILDEVQHMMKQSHPEHFTRQLNAAWEKKSQDADITLFLCGSEISVMSQLNNSDAALHGRFDYFDRLAPFDYYDAAKMMGERSLREYIKTYSIYGGIPGYLDSIPSDSPLENHVCRNILSKNGPVSNQLDKLFVMEEGIHEPRKYRSVLTAVAHGNTKVNDIAQASGVTGKNNEPVRTKLEKMIDLFLVRRERNFETEQGHYRYYVDDPAVRFWYRFVHDNRGRLDRGMVEDVWKHKIVPVLDDYIGHVFEQVCEQACFRFGPKWGLKRPSTWGRWVGTARSGRDIEIDIVSELDNGKMLTGEVKWSSTPCGDRLHTEHLEKIEQMQDTGKKWAHRAVDDKESEGQIYFSASGFTEEFQNRANSSDRITLISLEDIFPKPPKK